MIDFLVPEMIPIKEAAARTGLSYDRIRKLCLTKPNRYGTGTGNGMTMADLVTTTVPYVNIFLMGSFHGSSIQIICIVQDVVQRWTRRNRHESMLYL